MGERDNHVANSTSPQPRGGLLTHYHGPEERVVDREFSLPWHWCCNGGASPSLVSSKGEAKFVTMVGSPEIRVFLSLYVSRGALWPSNGWTLDPMALGHL